MTMRVPLTRYGKRDRLSYVGIHQSAGRGSWRNKRKCLPLTPSQSDAIFFPKPGGKSNQAKKFCSGCPVQAKCLEEAITLGSLGMWAGTTEGERRRMAGFMKLVVAQMDDFLPPEAINPKRPRRLKKSANILDDPLYGLEGPSDQELMEIERNPKSFGL